MSVQETRIRLESWKAIAAHFGRGERTVRRWEVELNLPVHRMPGAAKGRVYALVDELESWRTAVKSSPALNGQDDEERPPPQLEELAPEPPQAGSSAAATIPIQARAPARRWGLGALVFLTLAGLAGWAVRSAPRSRPGPPPYAAEKLYVQGTESLKGRTPASLATALADFKAALKVDPEYAQAWLGLAKTYKIMRELALLPDFQAYPLVREAAQKALTLDDRLAEAHANLAFADYWGLWRATEARREFQRALALDPRSATTHHWFATFLLNRGEPEGALREIDRALALDPTSEAIAADRGLVLFHVGKPDEGLRALTTVESRDPAFSPAHRYLWRIYLALGRDQDFLREAVLAAHNTTDHPDLEAARRGLATGGHDGMLRAMLADRIARYNAGSGSAISVANALARLGEPRTALLWLTKSAERHEPGFVAWVSNPDYQPVRTNPEFRALAARIE